MIQIVTLDTHGVRTLHFGSDRVQGAMRISRPWDLELAYTREMMAALLLTSRWPEMPSRILQIGLGAASLTRFIHRHLPEAQQTVVELSTTVVGAARQMFQLPPSSDRLTIHIADGAAWVAHASESFDLILVDGFDDAGETGALESAAFYERCRQLLNPGGLLVANFLSRSPGFLAACLNLDAAFESRTRLLPQTPGGNVIAFGAVAASVSLDEETLPMRVAKLKADTGLDLRPLAERLVAQAGGMPFGV